MGKVFCVHKYTRFARLEYSNCVTVFKNITLDSYADEKRILLLTAFDTLLELYQGRKQ